MNIKFSKMHGLGNDFIVVDAVNQTFTLNPQRIQQLADRHVGIGFDQCLLLEPAKSADTDFFYRIYNADGQEVEQCGNGARCLALFIKQQQLSKKNPIVVGTRKRRMRLELLADDWVNVDMGPVELAPDNIPFKREQQQTHYTVMVAGKNIELQAINIGNPHAVITCADVQTAPVASLGAQIGQHTDFPEGVNVGFMQIIDRQTIQLRVYERGAGETLACGSGACAAVAAGILAGHLDEQVHVHLPGGELIVAWQGGQQPIYLAGPAVKVYQGIIDV